MTSPLPDYYRLLGIPRDATQEEIRRAYRKAARRYHPDTNQNPGETEVFLLVQTAYRVLSNPQERADYDAQLPPEPVAPRDLIIQTYYSRENILPLEDEQFLYVMLEFTPPPEQTPQRPPLNICLALDRSTSMKGRNLELLKRAVLNLLAQAQHGDIFSIVSFNDYADVVVPAGFNTDLKRAESRVYALQAAGGTEIYRGLEAALNEVRRFRDDHFVNQIILLTDGRTYGDEEKSLKLAERAASEGISITAMGLGAEWNDQFLDALARKTGGNSAYLQQPEQLQNHFSRVLQKLQNVYARDIILEVNPGENVEMAYVFRAQPDPLALPVEESLTLGAVSYSTPLQVIFELHLRGMNQFEGTKSLFQGSLQADILPLRGRHFRTSITARLPIDDASPIPNTEPKMLNALSNMAIYRLQEKAENAANSGDMDNAVRRLNYLATRLLEQGEQNLAKTVLLEAENLLRQGTMSQEGQKNIKYGTRALLIAPPDKTQNGN